MPFRIKTGLDTIEKNWPKNLDGARIGLLLHPASVNIYYEHAVDVFLQFKKSKLTALFGPQHGIRGEMQDNMVEWEGYIDRKTGILIYSLYGKMRKPTPKMLKNVDVLVVDLQDIGARYYTFIWTLALVMQACNELNKKVVVLDRPNPINGHAIEGTILKNEYVSFVGLHPLPVRHGMTIGEIALYIKDVFYTDLNLYVVKMQGWKRKLWFDETNLPWVFPSPNMPTLDTAAVYPGMCLLEGTNLSEGRGTTKPFEIFGAPFINPDTLINKLKKFMLPGVVFRPLYFLPTFQKYAGRICRGSQIHVTDREKYKPFKTAVAILKAVHDLYPKKFSWKKPPYEYEEVLLPIDILAGTNRLRIEIEDGTELKKMEEWWHSELTEFDNKTRKKYLLYQ